MRDLFVLLTFGVAIYASYENSLLWHRLSDIDSEYAKIRHVKEEAAEREQADTVLRKMIDPPHLLLDLPEEDIRGLY